MPSFNDFESTEGSLSLFKNFALLSVLHELMGFVLDNVLGNCTKIILVEGTILALACLVSFNATTGFSLHHDGTNSVNAHFQKLYHDTFSIVFVKI